MTKRIGILTGGGDAPGLNPAIKYATKKALASGYEVYGLVDGWKGLIEPGVIEKTEDLHSDLQNRLQASAKEMIKREVHEFFWKDVVKNAGLLIAPLSKTDVSKWGEYPGTNLGSSRTNPFGKKNDKSKVLFENIEKLGLDYIIAIGGEDTLGAGNKASKLGINVIGIPKTIDGDLLGTDYTLGFETAVDVIKEAVKNLHGTAKSHDQTTILETMGRHSGLLAYASGNSTSVGIVLIPEWSPSLDEISDILMRRKKEGVSYDIIVVSEGTKIKEYEDLISRGEKDEFGHIQLGGIAERLKTDLEKRTDQKIRSTSLGYLQRGAAPNSYDVRKARHFGIAAVELIEKGISGRMVSYTDGKITH
ncbi:MAG: ATP-dependent 6-phosphofructokinase, partial [Candidatus Scalindua sp.]|nr:ATP-dependent 6-phosphofructokinase [Candidatus Scalindua sp.]